MDSPSLLLTLLFVRQLKKIDSVPGPDVMTHEMYADYFPDHARNPWDRPTFWPHTKAYQPENDPHTCK